MKVYNSVTLYLLLYFITWGSHKSMAQDYTAYHLSIIKAEEQLFVKGQIAEGLNTYTKVFQDYDFVFLSDCVTAIEMSLYANNEKAFLFFVDKATKNGLMPRHLQRITYIKKHPIYQKYKDSIAHLYHANRPHYLKRIDTTAMKTIYSLCAHDQVEKVDAVGESSRTYLQRYKPQITATVTKLQKVIEEKGWPSDKLIGVNQNDIMKELKLKAPDFYEYYIKYKQYSTSIWQSQFTLDELSFGSTLVFPIIIHYGGIENQYDKKRFLFYADSFFVRQIKMGNMHPKDLAFLYDAPYSFFDDKSHKPDPAKGDKYFGTGLQIAENLQNSLVIPDNEIDKIRAKYFIAPINNDRAKWKFFYKNRMRIGWGYYGSRS